MSFVYLRRRDWAAFTVILVVTIAMFSVGTLTIKSVKEAQLRDDAQISALRWAKTFDHHSQDIRALFHDRQTVVLAQSIVSDSQQVSRIISYELYTAKDRWFYSAGAADWQPNENRVTLLESPLTREHIAARFPTTRLHNQDKANGPRRYASVVIPFYFTNEYLGSVMAYIDQTELNASLTRSFGVIATVTIVIFLILTIVSFYVTLSKSWERWQAEERVSYLSRHDELTGLSNLGSFNEHLGNSLEASKGAGDHLAAIVIDIDRFKEINDALGHAAGDSVLRHIAERLKSNIRDGDFAARIGSDQFALTLSSIKRPQQAAMFVSTLSEALSTPLWISGEKISCSVSIGCALAPIDANEAAILMRHANLALARAKAESGNSYKFYEQGMDAAFIKRRDLEADLRRAIDSEQFDLHYQPLIDLGTQTISGYEALIRWNHPRDGLISPAYFIPLAEDTELIVPIGEWVLHRACMDAATWPKPLKVSVNLSAVQFKRINIVELVKDVLEETSLDPTRLELEITESLLISTTGKVADDLNGLRDLGVSIAMDDFGTGYSSLSYISSFPFNKIKIDKSFIHAMIKDSAILGIVKCIIAMGRSLGVTITAEGVETPEQSRILKGLGCHQVQGFLYSRPVSVDECVAQISDPLKIVSPGEKSAKSYKKTA